MKPVLLIIDDNEEILSFLEEDLGEEYRVITCTNGPDALRALDQQQVHLIVSDVMMTGMDGFELCSRIKGNAAYSHIPVVLLTAKNTMQAKIEGLEQGADAYVEKPFSPAFLQAQIASLLRNRGRVQAYFAGSVQQPAPAQKPDESFLESISNIIQNKMEDPEFDVEHLARLMNMSRPTLYRKIKEVSSLTPLELINLTRLKKAAALIREGSLKLYEISYIVGFHSQNNFCRNFLKQFGMTPTQYMARANEVRT